MEGVICGIHNCERKHVNRWAKKSLGGCWFNIVNIVSRLNDLGVNFNYTFDICLGDGKKTMFWLDDWMGNGTLAIKFPHLFELDKRKSCFVTERVGSDRLK